MHEQREQSTQREAAERRPDRLSIAYLLGALLAGGGSLYAARANGRSWTSSGILAVASALLALALVSIVWFGSTLLGIACV